MKILQWPTHTTAGRLTPKHQYCENLGLCSLTNAMVILRSSKVNQSKVTQVF